MMHGQKNIKLNVGPAVVFEILVPVYQTTWYYMLEDLVF